MDLILLQKMGDNISPFGLGFNPYFNGSNTSTLYCHNYHNHNLSCFNPYFNGSNTSTVFCR